MSDDKQPSGHAWLKLAGYATLLLAALVGFVALRQHDSERRKARDIGARAEAIMNELEAEAQRMENRSTAP